MIQIMDASDVRNTEQSLTWECDGNLRQGKHHQIYSCVQQPLDPTGVDIHLSQTHQSPETSTTPNDENKMDSDISIRKEVTLTENMNEGKKISSGKEHSGMGTVQFSSFKCKKVGSYLLGPSIGEGSYGKVRLATHFISKQMVAVKVVNKKKLVQREVARRHFRRETLLLQRLSHPNIVKLYEAMETCNSYYLVFELANGGSVLDILAKKGTFSEDESRHYMRQVTSAIDHIHRSDVVHRDIKLENLLIDSNGDVKLVDFGLSAVCHDSDHQLSTQCGSPVFAAPEMFAGRKYGKPVDLWSIGVCLFAMLTGKLPFMPEDGTSLTQLYSLILKGCVLPCELSLNCQNLLGRLLDLQEGRRISAEELLAHPWILGPDGQRVNRIPSNSHKVPIDPRIVSYMTTVYTFSRDDVINSVQQRKLNSTAATYNILKDSIGKGLLKISVTDCMISLTPSGTGSGAGDPVADSSTLSREGKINPGFKEQLISSNGLKKKMTSLSPDSYKSHLLVLKHSKNHRRSNEASNTYGEKFKTGKAGLTSSSVGQGAVPIFITPLSAVPLTLPPIHSADSAGVGGNVKVTQKDTDGKRHFILPDRREVLRLNVKGEAPNLCNRTKFHLPPTGSHNISLVHGYHHHRRNPPPPPPNSYFGDNSAVSRSTASHAKDLRKPSNSSEARRFTESLPESVTHEQDDRKPEELKETFVSRLMFFREPRTSLATLRDPFGTDSWRSSRLGQKLSGKSNRDKYPIPSSNPEHIPKAVSDFDDWRDKFRGQGENREIFNNEAVPTDAEDLDNRGKAKNISPPGSLGPVAMVRFPAVSGDPLDTQDSPRQGSVTPSSLSQEYLSPVTRVTITTTGHH